ncbi:MAG: helix-turn-helix transcriptional regulator [Acidobacteriota bacterium]
MGRNSLGEFELIVLLAAMQLGPEDAHTLAIVDEIRRRTDRDVKRAAVYVTLQRLENKGLVTSWLSEPRAERGGKGRRHVRLLPAGKTAVAESRTALRNMWVGLESALGER